MLKSLKNTFVPSHFMFKHVTYACMSLRNVLEVQNHLLIKVRWSTSCIYGTFSSLSLSKQSLFCLYISVTSFLFKSLFFSRAVSFSLFFSLQTTTTKNKQNKTKTTTIDTCRFCQVTWSWICSLSKQSNSLISKNHKVFFFSCCYFPMV